MSHPLSVVLRSCHGLGAPNIIMPTELRVDFNSNSLHFDVFFPSTFPTLYMHAHTHHTPYTQRGREREREREGEPAGNKSKPNGVIFGTCVHYWPAVLFAHFIVRVFL